MSEIEDNREWARRLERRERADYFRRLALRARRGGFHVPSRPWSPWPDTESLMYEVRQRSEPCA